jgi:hypothetical protein
LNEVRRGAYNSSMVWSIGRIAGQTRTVALVAPSVARPVISVSSLATSGQQEARIGRDRAGRSAPEKKQMRDDDIVTVGRASPFTKAPYPVPHRPSMMQLVLLRTIPTQNQVGFDGGRRQSRSLPAQQHSHPPPGFGTSMAGPSFRPNSKWATRATRVGRRPPGGVSGVGGVGHVLRNHRPSSPSLLSHSQLPLSFNPSRRSTAPGSAQHHTPFTGVPPTSRSTRPRFARGSAPLIQDPFHIPTLYSRPAPLVLPVFPLRRDVACRTRQGRRPGPALVESPSLLSSMIPDVETICKLRLLV